jgi:hypothetical protein
MFTDEKGSGMTAKDWRECATDGCGEILEPHAGRGRPRKFCDTCRALTAARDGGTVRAVGVPWRVDDANVQTAAAEMGVEHPVYVRRSRGVSVRGRYHGFVEVRDIARASRPLFAGHAHVHYVTIAARLHPSQASRIIYHEMQHARQAEIIGPDHMRGVYGAALRACRSVSPTPHVGYLLHPLELEARAAESWHDRLGSVTTQGDTLAHLPAYDEAAAQMRATVARNILDRHMRDALDALHANADGPVFDILPDRVREILDEYPDTIRSWERGEED